MPRRSQRPAARPVGLYSIDDVTFDERTHTSTLPDGRNVPHVTRVLGDVGVATDFEELAGVSLYVGENIETARLRGQAVHADCHAYDDDALIMETVHPAVKPYVDAWAFMRAEKELVPEARERRLYHPTYVYAGIMDGIFWWSRKGRHVLIDIKTGDPEDSACHLQTAAYESAWRAMTGFTAPMDRWAVHLTPKNRVPYRIKDYSARVDAAADWGKWLACLCVYNEQRCRRKAVA